MTMGAGFAIGPGFAITGRTSMTEPRQPERFADLVGYRLAQWRADHAEIVLALGPQHVNRTGRLHGGVLATLIDAACGYAGTFAVEGRPRHALTLAFDDPARLRKFVSDRLFNAREKKFRE